MSAQRLDPVLVGQPEERQHVVLVQPHRPAVQEVEEAREDVAALGVFLHVQHGDAGPTGGADHHHLDVRLVGQLGQQGGQHLALHLQDHAVRVEHVLVRVDADGHVTVRLLVEQRLERLLRFHALARRVMVVVRLVLMVVVVVVLVVVVVV